MTFFKSNEVEQLEWESAHGPIRCANFEESPNFELKDNFTAMGCIVVITNNRSFGTLTHLDTEVDIERFVSCLDKILGKHKSTNETFLIGGNNKRESKDFLQNLRKILKANQYVITAEYTGGSPLLKRRSILLQDKVQVETVYPNHQTDIKEIEFKSFSDLSLNKRIER